jgi:hypothetical protein
MSNIPIPFIQGATDAEKVTEIASYLKSLSSAVERELMSIDSTNLNEELRTRIDSSLTEHQDLTGFASKNYLKNHFYEKEMVDIKLDNLEKAVDVEISSAVTPISNSVNSISQTVGGYSDEFDEGTLCYLMEKIYHQLFERSGLLETSTILDRIIALERKIN